MQISATPANVEIDDTADHSARSIDGPRFEEVLDSATPTDQGEAAAEGEVDRDSEEANTEQEETPAGGDTPEGEETEPVQATLPGSVSPTAERSDRRAVHAAITASSTRQPIATDAATATVTGAQSNSSASGDATATLSGSGAAVAGSLAGGEAVVTGAEAGAISPSTEVTANADDGARAQLAGHSESAPTARGARAADAPRFIDPRTVLVVENARASIFKKIAMRFTDGGGELRMRLDPPELGQLDLRMIVDKSGAMRLQMIAERPEVTHALEKHLGELQKTLAEQGITVSEASIRSRDRDGEQGHDGDHDGSGFDDFEAEESDLPAADTARGFITGNGLNFLV